MKQPSIGVIAHRMSYGFAEISYFRQLTEVAKNYNIPIFVFSVDDVDVKNKRIHGLWYSPEQKKWVRRWSAFPSIVYDRVRYHNSDQFRRYVKLRKSGLMRFSYHGYSHKLGVYNYLASFPELAPYIPETEKVESLEQVLAFVKRGPSILKPINGSGGRGIHMLEEKNGQYYYSGKDEQKQRIHERPVTVAFIDKLLKDLAKVEPYLIQRKIPIEYHGRICDTRVLIQKDGNGKWTVTGMGTRIGQSRSVVSNLAAGASAMRTEDFIEKYIGKPAQPIMNEIKRVGLLIAERLDEHFGNFVEFGLDIGITPQGTFQLIEANSKPDRKIFKRTGQMAKYQEALRKPLEYHLYLIHNA